MAWPLRTRHVFDMPLSGLGIGEHSENGICDVHIIVCTNGAHLDMALIGGNEWLAKAFII
jgi:hypothetical protein